MFYKEELRDLFSVSNNYYLAHCISSDYALGAGIAVEFNKRFNMRKKLQEKRPSKWKYGECILIERILNLITKEKYWHKPTYKSITEALTNMKEICLANNINKIAMPIIGCGLDRLKWEKVSEIIQQVFKDTDIEILVCKQ